MSKSNKEENNQKNEQSTKDESADVTKNLDENNKEKTVEEKLKESEEKLLRSLAEVEIKEEDLRKKLKMLEFGSFNFARESLAILDNLQRAKQAIKNDEKLKDNKDLDKFLDNISIIEKDLVTIFEKNRIKKILVANKKFDPNFHQAMSEIEDDNKESGTILHEIQAGYMLGERLLRPALVSVAKKKTPKDHQNKDKKEEK